MNGIATRAVLIRWQIRRRMGQPLSSLCAPCVFPLLSFGVVALAFESVVRPYLHGMRYVAYLVPLVILNTVLFGSAADGADAWREAGSAIVRRLASLDFDATAFAASRAIGYGVACALQTAVFAVALGLLTGLARSALGLVATVMLVTTFSVGVGAFATGLGFQSRAPDDAPGLLHALFLPVTFLSTAYVPMALFPAGVRLLVELNPISWLAQTSRALLSGASPQLSQLLGVIAAATALCVVGLLFAHRSERRREAA
jgi:ABC-type polysaccharide/polyol phosphate export permease